MDYALLSRYSIQSTSDQEDYRNYATIAANVQLGVTPEQAAVWSYPINHEKPAPEEVIYNMVNALLLRIHQSGHLAELPKESVELVKDGIRLYKTIRDDIRKGVAFLPCGFADNRDTWICAGLRLKDRAYLAVWKRQMEGKRDNRQLWSDYEKQDGSAYTIPLENLPFAREGVSVTQIYPSREICDLNSTYKTELAPRFTTEGSNLTVFFKEPVMARLYEIRAVR